MREDFLNTEALDLFNALPDTISLSEIVTEGTYEPKELSITDIQMKSIETRDLVLGLVNQIKDPEQQWILLLYAQSVMDLNIGLNINYEGNGKVCQSQMARLAGYKHNSTGQKHYKAKLETLKKSLVKLHFCPAEDREETNIINPIECNYCEKNIEDKGEAVPCKNCKGVIALLSALGKEVKHSTKLVRNTN